jgi:hypothetical protein
MDLRGKEKERKNVLITSVTTSMILLNCLLLNPKLLYDLLWSRLSISYSGVRSAAVGRLLDWIDLPRAVW